MWSFLVSKSLPANICSQFIIVVTEDVVEKIAELDLELSEGDITQKGYEKKKTKLLAPFLRENQVKTSRTEEQTNGVKVTPRQANGSSSHQPPPASSSSSSSFSAAAGGGGGGAISAPSAPTAPPAESSQTSGASGMSDSSGKISFVT